MCGDTRDRRKQTSWLSRDIVDMFSGFLTSSEKKGQIEQLRNIVNEMQFQFPYLIIQADNDVFTA